MDEHKSFPKRRFKSLENSPDLVEFTDVDAKNFTFAPGDIFWKKSDGRLYRLAQAGDYLGPLWFRKYLGASLYCQKITQDDFIARGSILFEAYLQASYEKQRINACNEFLNFLRPVYWDGDEKASWLNLVLCMHKFLSRSELDELKLDQYPDLFRRSSLVGSLSVLGAMCLGYHKKEYLQDIYTLAFLMDISLHGKNTLKLYEVMDSERRSREAFKNALQECSKKEKQLYDQHPEADYKIVCNRYEHLFHYKSSLKILLWQHERANGAGGPRGLNQDELADIETWVAYCHRLFPLSSFSYQKSDGRGALKGYFETYRQKRDDFFFMGRRVFILIESYFEGSKREVYREGA